MLGELVTGRPLFAGHDEIDQLGAIMEVLRPLVGVTPESGVRWVAAIDLRDGHADQQVL